MKQFYNCCQSESSSSKTFCSCCSLSIWGLPMPIWSPSCLLIYKQGWIKSI